MNLKIIGRPKDKVELMLLSTVEAQARREVKKLTGRAGRRAESTKIEGEEDSRFRWSNKILLPSWLRRLGGLSNAMGLFISQVITKDILR